MRIIAFATYDKLPRLSKDDLLAVEALCRSGAEVHPAVWNSAEIVWEEFDAIVLRSCWDYHLRPDEFAEWLDAIEKKQARLWNPVSVVRWNMNKFYLRDLMERGFYIAPTVWLKRGSIADLRSLLERKRWTRAVVKPAVSASAHRTWIASPESADADELLVNEMLQSGDAIIQKFIDEIQIAGEWSLIFFDKEYSHSVLKRAKEGDFRVQNDYGGNAAALQPSAFLIEQAQNIIDSIEEELVYARVDGVEIDGRFALMELELIEPALFLSYDPSAADRFAQAILRGIKSTTENTEITERES